MPRICILLLFMAGCSLQQQTKAPLLSKVDLPTQQFRISQSSAQTITTPKGTRINIPAHSFNTRDTEVAVKLREVTTVKEALLSGQHLNIHQNGRAGLLESAGMVHLTAYDSLGTEINLRPGASLQMRMPDRGQGQPFYTYQLERGSWAKTGMSELEEGQSEIWGYVSPGPAKIYLNEKVIAETGPNGDYRITLATGKIQQVYFRHHSYKIGTIRATFPAKLPEKLRRNFSLPSEGVLVDNKVWLHPLEAKEASSAVRVGNILSTGWTNFDKPSFQLTCIESAINTEEVAEFHIFAVDRIMAYGGSSSFGEIRTKFIVNQKVRILAVQHDKMGITPVFRTQAKAGIEENCQQAPKIVMKKLSAELINNRAKLFSYLGLQ